jgi:hypothetical protein
MPPTKLTIPRRAMDPRYNRVQINIKIPWWYREQLIDEANRFDLTVPRLVKQVIEAAVPPDPPS